MERRCYIYRNEHGYGITNYNNNVYGNRNLFRLFQYGCGNGNCKSCSGYNRELTDHLSGYYRYHDRSGRHILHLERRRYQQRNEYSYSIAIVYNDLHRNRNIIRLYLYGGFNRYRGGCAECYCELTDDL